MDKFLVFSEVAIFTKTLGILGLGGSGGIVSSSRWLED